MRKIILVFFILLSFGFSKNQENMVTAEDIVSLYANYKLKRDEIFEKKIIRPRVKNFAEYLYLGLVELKEPNKGDALAYGAVLSLLSKQGRDIFIPDGYEKLGDKIKREIKLIIEANKTTTSPILGVRINYRLFQVPPKYSDDKEFYRAMKFAQTMPFFVNYSKITKVDKKTSNKLLETAYIINKTINSSERLTNLYKQINSSLERFVGIENDLPINSLDAIKDKNSTVIRVKLNQNPKYPIISDIPFLLSHYDKKTRGKVSMSIRLFPSRYTLDSYIFANTPKSRVEKISKPTLNDIIKIISPKRKIKSAYSRYPKKIQEIKSVVDKKLLTLNSSYDYDFKIMQTLIKSNHIKAFKLYYQKTKERTKLYGNKTRVVKTRDISKKRKTKIESNLSKTLDVMIEESLLFASSNYKNSPDMKMVNRLRKIRNIALKSEKNIKLSKEDIEFLSRF